MALLVAERYTFSFFCALATVRRRTSLEITMSPFLSITSRRRDPAESFLGRKRVNFLLQCTACHRGSQSRLFSVIGSSRHSRNSFFPFLLLVGFSIPSGHVSVA